MKRILILLVVVFLTCLNAYGQLSIVDPVVDNFLALTGFDQYLYYAEALFKLKEQAESLVAQVKHAERQVEMAMQNLESLNDIDSWDDFMDWYNRQLYFERSAIQSAKNMNVTIGKKNYSIYDLEGIAEGLDDTLINYWDKEFTEEQRREMWLELGLSPSNYAYVQPYRLKGREISRQLFTMSDIQNEKNNKSSEANKKDLDDLKKDSKKKSNDPTAMGEKQLFTKLIQAVIRGNETLEDISAIEAKRAEMEGIDKKLAETPVSKAPLAEYKEDGFEPF